uniref:Uncharacterized protein n=1 Tax=Cacopsylla melanoneura TaxID=428564 RepID=A0A8D8YXB1_9HEMI
MRVATHALFFFFHSANKNTICIKQQKQNMLYLQQFQCSCETNLSRVHRHTLSLSLLYFQYLLISIFSTSPYSLLTFLSLSFIFPLSHSMFKTKAHVGHV